MVISQNINVNMNRGETDADEFSYIFHRDMAMSFQKDRTVFFIHFSCGVSSGSSSSLFKKISMPSPFSILGSIPSELVLSKIFIPFMATDFRGLLLDS
jgi:hypothetical protein